MTQNLYKNLQNKEKFSLAAIDKLVHIFYLQRGHDYNKYRGLDHEPSLNILRYVL